MDTIILSWGLLPVLLGLGFIYRPKQIAKFEKAYAARAKKLQKRLYKAHRATGLLLVNVGVVVLITHFYPIWVYNFFYLVGFLAGTFFPGAFTTISAPPSVVPTYWI